MLALAAALVAPARARVLLAQQDALALAFPGCQLQKATLYLTAAQLRRATELAGEAPRTALVPVVRATCNGRPAGTAYFDVHQVRTLQETLMITVDAQGRVGRVEVLAFDEPTDYLPRHAWYEQFPGKALDPELQVKRGIHGVTGASLTARATTAAVRRALAIDRAVREGAGAAPSPAAAPPPAAAPAPTPKAAPTKGRPR